jgi:subtilisin-like proprotein convertase family protein
VDYNGDPALVTKRDVTFLERGFRQTYNAVNKKLCDDKFREIHFVDAIAQDGGSPVIPRGGLSFGFRFSVKGVCRGCDPNANLFSPPLGYHRELSSNDMVDEALSLEYESDAYNNEKNQHERQLWQPHVEWDPWRPVPTQKKPYDPNYYGVRYYDSKGTKSSNSKGSKTSKGYSPGYKESKSGGHGGGHVGSTCTCDSPNPLWHPPTEAAFQKAYNNYIVTFANTQGIKQTTEEMIEIVTDVVEIDEKYCAENPSFFDTFLEIELIGTNVTSPEIDTIETNVRAVYNGLRDKTCDLLFREISSVSLVLDSSTDTTFSLLLLVEAECRDCPSDTTIFENTNQRQLSLSGVYHPWYPKQFDSACYCPTFEINTGAPTDSAFEVAFRDAVLELNAIGELPNVDDVVAVQEITDGDGAVPTPTQAPFSEIPDTPNPTARPTSGEDSGQGAPTATPSSSPSASPSRSPSSSPTSSPSTSPSGSPSTSPNSQPSESPSSQPSSEPSITAAPSSIEPSSSPSTSPSQSPSESPSEQPSGENELPITSSKPSVSPSEPPSLEPSDSPSLSFEPTSTEEPSLSPSESPSLEPSGSPSLSLEPTTSEEPSQSPSLSLQPSTSIEPSESPSLSLQPSLSSEPTLSTEPSSEPANAQPTNARPTNARPTNAQPTAAIPVCSQQECSYRLTANVDTADNAIIVDEEVNLDAVSFIKSIQVDIATIFGEDLFIVLYSPGKDEYVLMEGTRAIKGPQKRNFDLGKEANDPTLANVAPYVFVEKDGSAGFIAPYSSPGRYNAEKWETGKGPYAAGEWNIFIEDRAVGDPSSIGDVVIEYCGICDAKSSAAPAQPPSTPTSPTTSSSPSVQPSLSPSMQPSPNPFARRSRGPTVTQDTPRAGKNRRGGMQLRHKAF